MKYIYRMILIVLVMNAFVAISESTSPIQPEDATLDLEPKCNCEDAPSRTSFLLDLNEDGQDEQIVFHDPEFSDIEAEMESDASIMCRITTPHTTLAEFPVTTAISTRVVDVYGWKVSAQAHILVVKTEYVAYRTAPLRWSCTYHFFLIEDTLNVTPLITIPGGHHDPEGRNLLNGGNTIITHFTREQVTYFGVQEEDYQVELAPDGRMDKTITNYDLYYNELTKTLEKQGEHTETIQE